VVLVAIVPAFNTQHNHMGDAPFQEQAAARIVSLAACGNFEMLQRGGNARLPEHLHEVLEFWLKGNVRCCETMKISSQVGVVSVSSRMGF
jgi:hypothetical protein